MRRCAPKGFTLIELLVVICIILILLALMVVLIRGVMERAKNTKSKAFIEMLDRACKDYHTDCGQYPPGPGSQNLHRCLGSPRVVVVQYVSSGPNITTTKPPYVEFKKEMLPITAVSTSPNPPQVLIDAWERVVEYGGFPGQHNTKAVDIWSSGKDGLNNTEDDIANWIRDF
ncbi:MAG: prepilin-type N-terminal cleavage/methylation domain-containing protein [Planctomycetes bacterium]|nr:prepilin-type N-terminal cleavage/methylation domain-containing protein [Planctomycetota bacterium]